MDTLSRKKNLGQYFTGNALARLLSYLSFKSKNKKIIDPMCGIGDMLYTYSELTKNAFFQGIEIDNSIYPDLLEKSKQYPENHFEFISGNAFSMKTLESLKYLLFDLVITNPPYVRYQRISKKRTSILPLLNAKEIRNNLLKFSSSFPFEDEQDRTHFGNIISSYSGLSDLAVPSWLLCAMLTKIGGTLAIVVPDTWLNREYALIIQYLLLRWFRIKYIVEDSNSSWFQDAQVKTTLLIAERIDRKDSAFTWKEETFQHLLISAKSISANSIVGNIYPNNLHPEKALLEDLKLGNVNNTDLMRVQEKRLSQKAENLKVKISDSKWFNQFEISNIKLNKTKDILPPSLQKWLGKSDVQFKFLNDFGVQIGQGLRTGANKFFYVGLKKELKDSWLIAPDKIFGSEEITAPKDCIEKVLRRQNELNGEFQLNSDKISGGVLVIKNKIQKDDFTELLNSINILHDIYQELPNDLNDLIKQAEKINIGSETDPKYIPQLSAVLPNIRKWNPSKSNLGPRFWYMLPPLKNRHIPGLFVPRINNKHPRTVLNSPERVVIDANFSTIWLLNGFPKVDKYAILAILNSSWSYCLMELTSTVMGGGALKLEATHLRNIPFPQFNEQQLNKFSSFGKNLISEKETDKVLNEIDDYFMEILFGKEDKAKKLIELNQIKNQKLSQRIK